MTSDIDKLLGELQTLSAEDMRRMRRAIDEQLAEDRTGVGTNGKQRLQALNRLRKELATLPVCNPADGFSNRDHDKLLYGGDL